MFMLPEFLCGRLVKEMLLGVAELGPLLRNGTAREFMRMGLNTECDRPVLLPALIWNGNPIDGGGRNGSTN